MDDIPPPPPPPMPLFNPSGGQSKMYKDGKGTSLSEQISTSSSVIQTVAASGWYDSFNDDRKFAEKSETGYVGLSNQGATCYLNSLIQSLYMTPEFRSALYRWEYDPDTDGTKDECIPYQLQKLFARLQLSNKNFVDTKELTKSFGWTEHDSFQQHDVQELMRVLFEALEKSYSKGFMTENTLVENLYRGFLEDYIRCTECNKGRSRVDAFFDIQLVIRDVDNIYSALEKYTEAELLNGSNQYNCENCSKKVDALKGLRFKDFPYLLCLQLKRFDFDWSTMERTKLNNKVAFPYALDVSTPEKKEEPYELFAVLIASGGAMGGHYFSYIKSFETGKWYNFNDSSVTQIEEKEIEKMYGGEEEEKKAEDSGTTAPKPKLSAAAMRQKKSYGTNAYMLIYRRKSSNNLVSVPSDQIPSYLQEEVLKENQEFEAQREKFRFRKEALALRVQYQDKFFTVHVQKHETLKTATKMVFDEAVKAPSDITLDCVRLREYNVSRKIPGQTWVGKEDQTLAQLEFQSGKNLLLETRKPDEDFPADSDLIVKVAKVSMGTKYEELPGVDFHLPRNGTLGDLKDSVSEKFQIPRPHVCIVRVNGNNTATILVGDESELSSAHHIVDGTLLFAEDCVDPSKSVVVAQVELSPFMIEISFNIPGEKPFDQDVGIDKRLTILDLKTRIGEVLGLLPSEFKLCRNLLKHEYKRDDQTLEDASLFDGAAVLVEKGIPLKANQFPLVLYTYEMNKIEPWSVISTEIIDSELPLFSIKQICAEKLNTAPNLIRLRDKVGGKPGKTFNVDTQLVKEAITQLYDGKEIIAQIVKKPEHTGLKENEILIEIQKWSPSTWELGDRDEIVVDKDITVPEFILRVAEEYHIPYQNVSLAKPRQFHLKNVSKLPLLAWEISENKTLRDVFEIQDGDIILVKDLTEAEKVPLETLQAEEGIQLPTKHEKVSIPEPSIVIRTRYDKPKADDKPKENQTVTEAPEVKPDPDNQPRSD